MSLARKLNIMILLPVFVGLVFLVMWGCSSSEEEVNIPADSRRLGGGDKSENIVNPDLEEMLAGEITPAHLNIPGYEDWKRYFDEFVVVYFPDDSSLQARVPAITKSIKRVYLENATRLSVQVPAPVYFFLYFNSEQIKQRTDCEYTCVRGDTHHYMILTPLGETIMVRLLQEFDPDGTPYFFCYEGLVTYLNYSGENYVQLAYIDYYNGDSIPLIDMIDNDKYLSYDSTLRTVAAASLTEYLLASPNTPAMLLDFYKREDPPAEALKDIFGKSIAELHRGWIEYIREKSGINMER
jgi:hypothetical protein